MTTRLSQKAVEEMFNEDCINAGVPCKQKHGANQGYLRMQYSYGGMQVQYVYKCGGSYGLSSGFVGAREMYNWLSNFNPKETYQYYKQREISLCESKKKRDAMRK